MPFQIQTSELNEKLGSDYSGDTKIYGEDFSLFDYIDSDNLDDFHEEGDIGEATKLDGGVYFKTRNTDDDAVVLFWNKETSKVTLL